MFTWFKQPRVRLHWWIALLMAVCLVAMAALVGALTYERLRASAQETAQEMFGQVAQRNAQKVQDVLSGTGNAVEFLGSMPLAGVDGAGHIDRARLTALLLGTVQGHPSIYSIYVAFGSDEMLQVVGVHNRLALIAALGMPQGTHFAIRTMERSQAHGGAPMDSWVYVDARSVRLGVRGPEPVALLPSQSAWFQQAMANHGLQLSPATEIGRAKQLGMSLTHALALGGGVVGADLMFADFDAFAQAALSGHAGGVLLSNGADELLGRYAGPAFAEQPIQRMEKLALSANGFVAAAAILARQPGHRIQRVLGEEMVYARSALQATPTDTLWMTAFAPMAPFTAPLLEVQRELMWVTLASLLLTLPLAYAASRWLGLQLNPLVRQSQRLRDGDYSGDVPGHSPILELDALHQGQHSVKLALRDRSQALQGLTRQLDRLAQRRQLPP